MLDNQLHSHSSKPPPTYLPSQGAPTTSQHANQAKQKKKRGRFPTPKTARRWLSSDKTAERHRSLPWPFSPVKTVLKGEKSNSAAMNRKQRGWVACILGHLPIRTRRRIPNVSSQVLLMISKKRRRGARGIGDEASDSSLQRVYLAQCTRVSCSKTLPKGGKGGTLGSCVLVYKGNFTPRRR